MRNNRIISLGDFRDVYVKMMQRGNRFLLSKLTLKKSTRTKSSFNNTNIESSNWWIIPYVKKRWNYLITGNSNMCYEEYISERFCSYNIKLISIGSGICSHEIKLAKMNPNWKITCIDFSDKLLQEAYSIAKKENIKNIQFISQDIYKYDILSDFYDVALFNSSLHHFEDMEKFLQKIYNSLKISGHLIINEYVGNNRLQYNKKQINEINNCLRLINKKYRQIYKTKLYKNQFYGFGVLRMIISDPSECVESKKILPVIHSKFKVIEEKGYGGNILMPVLKDISHHFIELDKENKQNLDAIFDYEDQYLMNNSSDFVFGIYKKMLNNPSQHLN